MKITIKEAIKTTGKSEPTIRRLLSKKETKPFIDHVDGRVLIDVNYLFSVYPPIKKTKDDKVISNDISLDIKKDNIDNINELKHKIELLEKDLLFQKALNEEIKTNSNERIADLQNALRLLEYKKKESVPKKKKWWQF